MHTRTKYSTWVRKCPGCGTALYYSSNWNKTCADKRKSKCTPCSKLNYTHSKTTKEKIGKSNAGKKRTVEIRLQLSRFSKLGIIGMKGRNHSSETLRKMRIAAQKRLQTMHAIPSYNPEACKIIEEYGKQHGYNFQHAENGGEFHIKELGYWVDGYDREKNVVIEYDEPHHFTVEGKLRNRDIRRQKEIVECLKCEFIRIK